ncbi:MAG: hypothetical protein DMG64_10640 [Acidobacteria bacterium]|nr:MAG: hypothetical protein DMG64_10640 [Acidobacteriota bacterium]PYY23513.1 MAG: hypothetical protein DMG62_07555 [Acidobacteriota bacterium]
MDAIAVGPTTLAATWAGEPTVAPSTGELITTSVAEVEEEGVAGLVGVVFEAEPVELGGVVAPAVVVPGS